MADGTQFHMVGKQSDQLRAVLETFGRFELLPFKPAQSIHSRHPVFLAGVVSDDAVHIIGQIAKLSTKLSQIVCMPLNQHGFRLLLTTDAPDFLEQAFQFFVHPKPCRMQRYIRRSDGKPSPNLPFPAVLL